jgi:hypothetical protein
MLIRGFRFYIDRTTHGILDTLREKKSEKIVYVELDQQVASNRLMTKFEAQSLLGL